jgi:hypothetical protein
VPAAAIAAWSLRLRLAASIAWARLVRSLRLRGDRGWSLRGSVWGRGGRSGRSLAGGPIALALAILATRIAAFAPFIAAAAAIPALAALRSPLASLAALLATATPLVALALAVWLAAGTARSLGCWLRCGLR